MSIEHSQNLACFLQFFFQKIRSWSFKTGPPIFQVRWYTKLSVIVFYLGKLFEKKQPCCQRSYLVLKLKESPNETTEVYTCYLENLVREPCKRKSAEYRFNLFVGTFVLNYWYVTNCHFNCEERPKITIFEEISAPPIHETKNSYHFSDPTLGSRPY